MCTFVEAVDQIDTHTVGECSGSFRTTKRTFEFNKLQVLKFRMLLGADEQAVCWDKAADTDKVEF